MRKGKLEHLLTTGKIEGKRSRGRQRIKIQDGIAAWLGRSTAEMFVDARDREKWRVMIAYACIVLVVGINSFIHSFIHSFIIIIIATH